MKRIHFNLKRGLAWPETRVLLANLEIGLLQNLIIYPLPTINAV